MRSTIMALAVMILPLPVQTVSQRARSSNEVLPGASETHRLLIVTTGNFRATGDNRSSGSDCHEYYTQAMTLLNAGKFDDARRSFKDAITCDPNDPSSQLQLGELYYKRGYKTQTILALCRFLVLEPDSPRSQEALRRIGLIMHKTAGRPMVGGGVTFEVDPKVGIEEGDFTGVDGALAIIGVRLAPKQNKDKIDSESIIDELKVLLALLSETKPAKTASGFAWDYYRPYFVQIKSRHYEEPFCYYIAQSAKTYETKSWLARSSRKVEAFLAWSASYKWPVTTK